MVRVLPGWVRALWGAAVVFTNALLAVYLVVFFATFPWGRIMGGPLGPSGGDLDAVHGFLRAPGPTAVLLLLSAFVVGLTVMHIFVWSGMSGDRKLLWVAIVNGGLQIAALAYWWARVRPGARPEAVPAQAGPAPLPPRSTGLLALGLLSIEPLLFFILFLSTCLFAAVLAAKRQGGPPGFILWLFPGTAVTMLAWAVLTAVFFVDVTRTRRLEGWNRAMWAVALSAGGPLAWPIYWYVNMWRRG